MTEFQVALYARVSSEQQAVAHTIQSQIFALHDRIKLDGKKNNNRKLKENFKRNPLNLKPDGANF